MVSQPLFKIDVKLEQDFDFRFLYDNLDMEAAQLILDAFQENEIVLNRKVKPVIEKKNERWVIKGKDEKWYRIIKSNEKLNVYKAKSRHYTSTVLPTLSKKIENPKESLLISLYNEVCSNWRMLTDVRFKLLGLVPAVSVIAWGQLISADVLKKPPGSYAGIIIAIIGLLITIAIRLYDLRNDTLYDDLISRGRKIEEELNVDTGVFLGRVDPPNSIICHGTPVLIIYSAAIIGWISITLWFIFLSINPMAN